MARDVGLTTSGTELISPPMRDQNQTGDAALSLSVVQRSQNPSDLRCLELSSLVNSLIRLNDTQLPQSIT